LLAAVTLGTIASLNRSKPPLFVLRVVALHRAMTAVVTAGSGISQMGRLGSVIATDASGHTRMCVGEVPPVVAGNMTAELCPTCGIWWRGVEHSCRLPTYSTSTAGLPLADTDPRDAEIATLRAALDVAERWHDTIAKRDGCDGCELSAALATVKEAGG